MRNRFFFLVMMLATVLVACGQNADIYDTPYFTRKDMVAYNGNKMVFLYEKGNVKKPFPLDKYSRIDNTSQLSLYLGETLQKEFPDINSELMKELEMVTITFCYDLNGSIPYYNISMNEDLYDSVPNLERKLYHVMTALKNHGVKEYGLSFSDDTKCGQVWLILRSAFKAIAKER